MGKGSTPRPFGVKDDVFSENFCRTFGHRWRGEICVNCGAKPEGSPEATECQPIKKPDKNG